MKGWRERRRVRRLLRRLNSAYRSRARDEDRLTKWGFSMDRVEKHDLRVAADAAAQSAKAAALLLGAFGVEVPEDPYR